MPKGEKKRYEEAEPLIERILKILQQAEQFRNQVQMQAEETGVRLALLLASQLVHREIRVSPRVLHYMLQNNLRMLSGKGLYTLHLNPDDHAFFNLRQVQLATLCGRWANPQPGPR